MRCLSHDSQRPATAWWVSLITGVIAALVAMEVVRKAAHERLQAATSKPPAGTGMGDHATDVALPDRATR